MTMNPGPVVPAQPPNGPPPPAYGITLVLARTPDRMRRSQGPLPVLGDSYDAWERFLPSQASLLNLVFLEREAAAHTPIGGSEAYHIYTAFQQP